MSVPNKVLLFRSIINFILRIIPRTKDSNSIIKNVSYCIVSLDLKMDDILRIFSKTTWSHFLYIFSLELSFETVQLKLKHKVIYSLFKKCVWIHITHIKKIFIDFSHQIIHLLFLKYSSDKGNVCFRVGEALCRKFRNPKIEMWIYFFEKFAVFIGMKTLLYNGA